MIYDLEQSLFDLSDCCLGNVLSLHFLVDLGLEVTANYYWF